MHDKLHKIAFGLGDMVAWKHGAGPIVPAICLFHQTPDKYDAYEVLREYIAQSHNHYV